MAHNRKNRSPKHNQGATRGQAERRYQGGKFELNVNNYEHIKTLAHISEQENHIHLQESKKSDNKNEPHQQKHNTEKED